MTIQSPRLPPLRCSRHRGPLACSSSVLAAGAGRPGERPSPPRRPGRRHRGLPGGPEALADRDYAAAAAEGSRASGRSSPPRPSPTRELILSPAAQARGEAPRPPSTRSGVRRGEAGEPLRREARLLMADAYISLKPLRRRASVYRPPRVPPGRRLPGPHRRLLPRGRRSGLRRPARPGPDDPREAEILQHDWEAPRALPEGLATMGSESCAPTGGAPRDPLSIAAPPRAGPAARGR